MSIAANRANQRTTEYRNVLKQSVISGKRSLPWYKVDMISFCKDQYLTKQIILILTLLGVKSYTS